MSEQKSDSGSGPQDDIVQTRYEQHLQQAKRQGKQRQREIARRKVALLETTRLNNTVLSVWLLLLAILVLDKAIWAAPAPVEFSQLRFLLSLALDALPVGLVLGLLALAEWLPSALRPLSRLPAVGILLYMLGDASVRHTFNIRLAWDDVLPYLDFATLANFIVGNPLHLLPFVSILPLTAGVLLLAGGLVLSIGPRRERLYRLLAAAGAACVLAGTTHLLAQPAEADPLKWAATDILTVNALRGVDSALVRAPAVLPRQQCSSSQLAAPRRIIVVVLESFSDYQSRHFGGYNDWTPHLDKHSRRNKDYRNVVANGFTTGAGLVALLTGDVPLQPPADITDARLPVFRQHSSDGDQSLLRSAAAKGWHTRFITSGRLSFSGKGNWLQSIGFQHIEGGEHPSYTGKPRFIFGSVADEYLFERALGSMPEMLSPWLMVVETVSSHPPYISPATGERSPEAVVRYADGALDEFINKLSQTQFFDQDRGLLLVISDHHIMKRGSSEKGDPHAGLQQSWSIPLLLMTGKNERTRQYNTPFQHTDVYNGLRSIVRRSSCTSPLRGDIWLEKPAQCQIKTLPGERSSVHVSCGGDEYQLWLDGDDTRVIGDNASAAPAWLVPAINHIRQRPHIED